jgi:hypothetical protein
MAALRLTTALLPQPVSAASSTSNLPHLPANHEAVSELLDLRNFGW